MRITVSLALLTCLTACTLTPRLDQPALPVSASYPAQAVGYQASNTTGLPATALNWQGLFNDPRLRALIELALDNNRDLRLASLNVQAVQAQYRIQRADRLPSVAASATAVRERSRATGQASSAQPQDVSKQVGLSVGITAFELDLFGRVQSLSDAALARYLASDYGRRAAQTALVGAVADAYFAQRLAQEQLILAEKTVADWEQSFHLVHLRWQANQTSGLDLAQAQGQVAIAQADRDARQRALARADNALQLLIGTEIPDTLPAPLSLESQAAYRQIQPGLPSDLLLTRPELQQAEQLLIAANADVGAARAAFFPRISLTASFGYTSSSLNGLFDPTGQIWSFAPQITQPLFQFGRLRGELRVAELRKAEAVAQYERAIQIAFREVADALAGTATYGRQIEAQLRALSSAKRRSDLSTLRYRAGLEGRLEMLDAQRQLYVQRQALLDLRREEVSNVVALYKALGGGRPAQGLPGT